MGNCVSVPSRNTRRKKLHWIKKCSGKVSNSVVFKKRNSDAGTCVTDYCSVSEFVHMDFEDGSTATCRRSLVSNSTFKLTQLEWKHTQYDATNSSSQEESYFDTVSVLESDSDDDNNMCEEYHESYIKADAGKYEVSRFERSHGSFEGVKEQKHEVEEKAQENNTVKLIFPLPVSSYEKTPNRPSKPLQCQKMQTTIFKLSFKRRSCDTEEITEYGQSKRYLYRPRAGCISPCHKGEKPSSGYWSEIPPSTFKLRRKICHGDIGTNFYICLK